MTKSTASDKPAVTQAMIDAYDEYTHLTLDRRHFMEQLTRLAGSGAAAVAPGAGEVVLAADTTIAPGRRILGTPADEADLRRMLALLSGRRHHCLSAVTVIAADGTTTYCSTMTDTTKFHELGTSCTDAQGITLNLNP